MANQYGFFKWPMLNFREHGRWLVCQCQCVLVVVFSLFLHEIQQRNNFKRGINMLNLNEHLVNSEGILSVYFKHRWPTRHTVPEHLTMTAAVSNVHLCYMVYYCMQCMSSTHDKKGGSIWCPGVLTNYLLAFELAFIMRTVRSQV